MLCKQLLFSSILILVLFSFSLISSVAASSLMWNQTYGGTNPDKAYSLVETSDGGYAIAGYTTSFGAGNSDFWLIKTDIHGNVEWNQTYGGAEAEYAQSLVETSDGGYAIAGYTTSFGAGNSDFWLIKTDEMGNVPEFPSWLFLPLFLVATSFAVITKKKAFCRVKRTN
ncbi:MAG: hypothetical protein QCH99_07690 [Candidatus Bathyarchaeota archaeon]|nr:hypothetical protein [Candidatus Bathyarchaeum tardum]